MTTRSYQEVVLGTVAGAQATGGKDVWNIVLTQRGRFAIWGEQCTTSPNGLNREGFWQLVENLEEVHEIPLEIVAAAALVLHPDGLPNLDI